MKASEFFDGLLHLAIVRQFLSKEDLVYMALSYIAPARLFMNRLQKLLIRDVTARVRDEAEFIRSIPKDVDHETAQAFPFYLTYIWHKSSPFLFVVFYPA